MSRSFKLRGLVQRRLPLFSLHFLPGVSLNFVTHLNGCTSRHWGRLGYQQGAMFPLMVFVWLVLRPDCPSPLKTNIQLKSCFRLAVVCSHFSCFLFDLALSSRLIAEGPACFYSSGVRQRCHPNGGNPPRTRSAVTANYVLGAYKNTMSCPGCVPRLRFEGPARGRRGDEDASAVTFPTLQCYMSNCNIDGRGGGRESACVS